jgi:hypothetical protein
VASAYFAEACLYHRNDGGGVVNDPVTQLTLLNMVTAHIAKRYATDANGNAPSDLVGRIASATQGSVSVSTQDSDTQPSAQFWKQTKYGADYWQMTRRFRTMRYIRGEPRSMQPLF